MFYNRINILRRYNLMNKCLLKYTYYAWNVYIYIYIFIINNNSLSNKKKEDKIFNKL